jgi:hypothetical protein
MPLRRGAAPFLQGHIMEFTLIVDFGFGEKLNLTPPSFGKP